MTDRLGPSMAVCIMEVSLIQRVRNREIPLYVMFPFSTSYILCHNISLNLNNKV